MNENSFLLLCWRAEMCKNMKKEWKYTKLNEWKCERENQTVLWKKMERNFKSYN